MKYLLILILVLFCFQRSYSASRWKEVNISDLKISIPFNWSEQKLILRNNEYRFWSEDRLLLLRIYILNNKSNLKDIIDDINRKMINRKSGFRKTESGVYSIKNGKAFYVEYTNNEQILRDIITKTKDHNIVAQFIGSSFKFMEIENIIEKISLNFSIDRIKKINVVNKKKPKQLKQLKQKKADENKVQKKSSIKISKTKKIIKPPKKIVKKIKRKVELKNKKLNKNIKISKKTAKPNIIKRKVEKETKEYKPSLLRNPFSAPSRNKIIFEERYTKKVENNNSDKRVNYIYITNDIKKKKEDISENGFIDPKVLYLVFSIKGLPKSEKLYSIWLRKDGMKKILTYTIKNNIVENGYFYIAEPNFLKPGEYKVKIKYRGKELGEKNYIITKKGEPIKNKTVIKKSNITKSLKDNVDITDVKIIDSAFCSKIEAQKPQNISKTFFVDIGSVYAWYKLKIKNSKTKVLLKWFLGDTYILETPINVESGERIVSFSLEMTEGKEFPLGNYFGKLYYKDNLINIMSFKIIKKPVKK